MSAAGDPDHELLGWLKLARCDGIGPGAAYTLVEAVGGAAAFAAPAGDARRGAGAWRAAAAGLGLAGEVIGTLAGTAFDAAVRAEIETVRRLGWELLHVGSAAYPASLRHLKIPPPVLAVRGLAEALAAPSVAIVGSRHPSAYGLRVAADFAAGLAAAGIVVVSGLALGIDSAAHRAALATGGLTVAVMGTGPDRVYPAPNQNLAADIVRQGALVTEFAPGAPPLKEHFPRRNRIIAALADAVVVVEAAERSGALITAGLALELGRSVLAVPGRVGDPLAAGVLALLRDGATPACAVADILAELPPDRRPALVPPQAAEDPGRAAGPPGTDGDRDLVPRPGLTAEAAAVLAAVPPGDETHVDAVLEQLRWPTERVLATLFGLQLSGLLEALPGGRFRRTGEGVPGRSV